VFRPLSFVHRFETGERDLTLGEIMARAQALLGDLHYVFVETSKSESVIDPLTHQRVYAKRFCLGRFATLADAKLPGHQRHHVVFARTEAKLRNAGAIR
jgi:hypothetical protein